MSISGLHSVKNSQSLGLKQEYRRVSSPGSFFKQLHGKNR